jgi:8-oxo-dGTP pyrophosphatase MutT (NUDIX family)
MQKFKPKRGQVDYRNIRWAPVVNCVVRYRGKILLVRRNGDMHFYPGYYNGISGFLDDHKSLEEKVIEELREELGIAKKEIKKIKVGIPFDQDEPKYRKTWIVHPVLVDITTDKVRLDWEAEKYRWVKPAEARKLKLLPGFKNVLKAVNL